MTTTKTARGIRNNNPLNIEAGENWQGLKGTDGRFAIFETAEHGIRAAARILRTYARSTALHRLIKLFKGGRRPWKTTRIIILILCHRERGLISKNRLPVMNT